MRKDFALLVLLFAGKVPVVLSEGQVKKLAWAGWSIPAHKILERGALAVVEDKDAESIRTIKDDQGNEKEARSVLHQAVSRRGIAKASIQVAKTPLVKWKELVPGIYRVSARIKFSGDPGVIGTPIRLHVDVNPRRRPYLKRGENSAYKEFTNIDFTEEESEKYNEISFLYEVSPERDKRLEAREARTPWNVSRWLYEVYPDAVNVKKPRPQRKSRGFTIGLTLRQTKYRSKSGMPPNSLRWLRVDWLRIERIAPSPSITVRYVRPDKLWLRPGMETGFSICVENFTRSEQERILALVIERGLKERQTLHTEKIALAPGAARILHVPWKTTPDTPWWGYKVIAEVRNGEQVEFAATDYFQVHPDCYTVHILGSRTRGTDPFRLPESYRNQLEVFAATPGDMARILPKQDAWVSGMSGGNVVYTYKTVCGATEHNRKEGIMTAFYLFAGGCSTGVMDDYVAHPEWMSSKGVATDIIYRKTLAREKQVREWDWEKKGFVEPRGINTPHIEMQMNHRFPELKARIEKEFLEFVDRTGYDAVRFDVGMLAPRGGEKTILGSEQPVKVEDEMAWAAKNFNDLRTKIEAKYPDFEWGANMDTWAYLDTIKDRDITPKPPEEYPEFIALCRAHGMFMDEATMSAPLYDHYMNKWEDCWYFMNLKRKIARKYGGVYELFSPHRDSFGYFDHDDVYFATMIIASGSHYVGAFAPPPYSEGSMGAFATRFSEFFWNEKLRPLEDAEDRIYVDAPADLWFAEGAVQQTVGNRLRYVVPLINPPVVERLRRNKNNEMPPPIDEAFNIEIDLPGGKTSAEAWMLSWEPRVEAKRLESEVREGKLKIVFPGLKLFRALVVEFQP